MPLILPRKTHRQLMPHQDEMVQYLKARESVRKGGSLFVEMRLGKTLATIRFLKGQKNRKLIVAPLSVCKTWERELREDNERDILNIGGLTRQKKEKELSNRKATWTIVNYESAKKIDIHSYFSHEDAIVLDESIAIANPQSGVAKYFMSEKYFPQWRKYALCGLPAPESSMQYFNQVAFTQGSLLHCTSFYGFRAKAYDQIGYGWEPKPFTERDICDEVDRRCFVKTRDEVGVGSHKEYRRFYVQMTKGQKQTYREMLANFEIEGASTQFVTTQMLYLARIAGGAHPTLHTGYGSLWYSNAKLELVQSLIAGELRSSQVIVWFRFRAEVEKAHVVLSDALPNLRFGVITGETDQGTRASLRDKFMTQEIDVMLMTISTSKRGLDFSAADTEIYYSNEYSADARGQSEDRVIHPKKKKPVLVIDILTEQTVDEHVLDLLTQKKISQRMFMTRLLSKLDLDRKRGIG